MANQDEERRRAITAWWGRQALYDFIARKRAAQGIDVPSGIETAKTGSTEGESPVA